MKTECTCWLGAKDFQEWCIPVYGAAKQLYRRIRSRRKCEWVRPESCLPKLSFPFTSMLTYFPLTPYFVYLIFGQDRPTHCRTTAVTTPSLRLIEWNVYFLCNKKGSEIARSFPLAENEANEWTPPLRIEILQASRKCFFISLAFYPGNASILLQDHKICCSLIYLNPLSMDADYIPQNCCNFEGIIVKRHPQKIFLFGGYDRVGPL